MRNHRLVVATVLAAFVVVFGSSLTANAGPGDGTVLGTTKIVDNGPDNERFNFVVVAEGFTAAQQDDFNNRANELVAAVFGYPPMDTLSEAFNITRINVASDDAGADEPPLCFFEGIYVNTYFDATYCAGGVKRALVVNNSTVYSVLNTWTPSWDQAIVVVNHTTWGGTGGGVSVTSVASGWTGIVIHEMGHSAFGLADEYEYYAGCGESGHDYHSDSEPSAPNVTVQTVRELVKWNDLIEPSTPLPTTINANCAVCDPQGNPYSTHTVGLYEGAHYYHCDCYRPQFSCMMRNVAPYFCAVCRSVVETTLGAYLPAPNQAPVALCQDITVPASGGCEATVLPQEVDNGSYDPEGSDLQRSLDPAGPFPVGWTFVDLIISDGESTDLCNARITVEDVTAPVVTCPGDIAVTLGLGVYDTVITFVPSGSDECAGVTVSATPASGSVFSEGSVPVECVATDASGNEDTCYFQVTISLTCTCPYLCDFDADGFHTALDLADEIDVLFAGSDDPVDPGCPSPRGDFDCDGFTTALDLSGLIDLLYAGGAAPCDPCAP